MYLLTYILTKLFGHETSYHPENFHSKQKACEMFLAGFSMFFSLIMQAILLILHQQKLQQLLHF